MAFLILGIIAGTILILIGIIGLKGMGKIISLSIGGLLLLGAAGLLFFTASVPFGPGYGDFFFKINTDYSIQKTSAHQIVMYGKEDGKKQIVIEAKIVALDYDIKHIIVKQQHMRRKSPDNPNNTYMEPEPDSFSFWIVNKDMDQINGPFSEEEFNNQRKEMRVSDELRFKDVHSFKLKDN